MRENIQDALLSVGEVAAFVWSLLELLLTRILPLVGFLIGHLLLQLCRFLASLVIPAAGPHSEGRYGESSGELQAEEVIEGDDVLRPLGERDVDDLQGSDKLEDEDGDLLVDTAADHEVHVVGLEPSDEEVTKFGAAAAANEVQVPGSDGENEADAVANEMQLRGDVHGNVAEREPASVDVAAGEHGHASPDEKRSGGKVGLEPSNERRSTSTSSTRLSEEATRRSGSGGGEMAKSRKVIRVLPPSFSQIRRTLMQRSRRGSPSPQSISPATPTLMRRSRRGSPSPHSSSPATVTPIKKTSPRKRASASIKSSPSYNHFMSKFRKQFLLDPA